MAIEILNVGPRADDGLRRVEYRTADGETGWLRTTVPDSQLAADVEESIALFAKLDNPTGPPISFGMFVRMDMGNSSYEELQEMYTNRMEALGYDVTDEMVPHERHPT